MRLLVAVALALTACELPPPQPPTVDGCAAACENLRRLGCPEGQPTDAGESCEQVCDNAQASPAPLPTACVARAASCDEAAQCE